MGRRARRVRLLTAERDAKRAIESFPSFVLAGTLAPLLPGGGPMTLKATPHTRLSAAVLPLVVVIASALALGCSDEAPATDPSGAAQAGAGGGAASSSGTAGAGAGTGVLAEPSRAHPARTRTIPEGVTRR